MSELGVSPCPIPANADRSPCWPEGLVGSITHAEDTCVVALGLSTHWTSIGIDIEAVRAIDESIWESICTPREWQLLHAQAPNVRQLRMAQLFTAKEALYKWQFPLTRSLLDFHDVEFDWGKSRFELPDVSRWPATQPLAFVSVAHLLFERFALCWVLQPVSGVVNRSNPRSTNHLPTEDYLA